MVKHVKSNAVVFACGGRDARASAAAPPPASTPSTRRARRRRASGIDLAGSALASDAFFPFPDGLEAAAAAGATAFVQPGGSMRDDEVIAAADRLGVAMVFTGIRHFRH